MDPSDIAQDQALRHIAQQFSVVVVHDLERLASLVPSWEELAAAALEPNVFYEHWMLLPALKAYGVRRDIGVVLVLADLPHQQAGAGTLVGLFPLQLRPRLGLSNINTMSLWRHPHCYLSTPLVRRDCAAECITAFLRWLRSRTTLLELPWICGDGPFMRMLLDRCDALGLTNWITERYTRGLWRRPTNSAGAVGSAVSGTLRRRLRRKEQRLAECGRLEHVAMLTRVDIGRWTEEFLNVEASGWKGRCGGALACSEADRRYFTEIVAAAFRRGRLLMLGLDYDHRPIARRCAFVAGDGSFAFKTAYDERFAKYSPGAILELDSLTQLEALQGISWMDSCAAADNSLINRISNGRRAIQSVVIGGGPLGGLVISGQMLLRSAKRRLSRNLRPPDEVL
jgi:CelD/BcsL family acetyltransferase involved in cellulose biosynthesis